MERSGLNTCNVCGYRVKGKVHVNCALFCYGELSESEWRRGLAEELKLL